MALKQSPVNPGFRVFSALAVLFLLTHAGVAQIDTGAIVGTVRDASGAAVPKAAVELTNSATGLRQSTTTNDAGEYQFTALTPGTYSVRATATGFGLQVQSDIEIHVQSRPSVDFNLKVGGVTETIEVQSAGTVLQTQSADV